MSRLHLSNKWIRVKKQEQDDGTEYSVENILKIPQNHFIQSHAKMLYVSGTVIGKILNAYLSQQWYVFIFCWRTGQHLSTKCHKKFFSLAFDYNSTELFQSVVQNQGKIAWILFYFYTKSLLLLHFLLCSGYV